MREGRGKREERQVKKSVTKKLNGKDYRGFKEGCVK